MKAGRLSQEFDDSNMPDAHAWTDSSDLAIQESTKTHIVARGRSRLALNMLANAANVVVNIFVGIWFTRYLIRHIGVSAYGLVPLVSQVVSYFSILTLSLNSTVGRYLTVSLERGEIEDANGYFNTSVFGSLLIAVVLLVPGILLTLYPDAILDIPTGHLSSTRWLVAGVVGAFVIGLVISPFEVASFCRNRFDLRNLVSISAVLVRVFTIIVLFSLLGASLSRVGIGFFFGALVGAAFALVVWDRLMPMLTVDASKFNLVTLRKLTSTGGWIVVNQIGSVLYLSIDLLIINRLMGPEAGGRYAAVLQWSVLLRALAGAMAGVFAPTMMSLFATNSISELIRYSRNAVRLNGLLIALPIALICGFSKPLLRLWLGPDFEIHAPLLMLMTFPLSINLGVMPLFSIQLATNRVEWPGIVTCIMGVGNLGLALLLAGSMGWGMYGVAAAGAIMLTAKNAIFTPLYGARILGVGLRTFQKESFLIFTVTTVTTFVCWMLSRKLDIRSWSILIAVSAIISAGYAVAVYCFVLSPAEREAVKKVLSRGREAKDDV